MGHLFFIPINTPSSKNSKRWTGKILINSELVMRYKRNTKSVFIKDRELFRKVLSNLSKPYYIEFTFIRNSRRAYDYVNVVQVVLDLMQEHKWLDNDDINHVKPYFGDSKIDRLNPGCEIRILKNKPKHY